MNARLGVRDKGPSGVFCLFGTSRMPVPACSGFIARRSFHVQAGASQHCSNAAKSDHFFRMRSWSGDRLGC